MWRNEIELLPPVVGLDMARLDMELCELVCQSLKPVKMTTLNSGQVRLVTASPP